MTRNNRNNQKNWSFDLALAILAGLLLGLVIFLPFMAFRHRKQASPEALIQAEIIAHLVAAGCLVLRINSGRKGNIAFVRWFVQGFTSTEGVSDLLALAPNGRLLAIECKAPGEKAKFEQSRFLFEAEQRGAVAIVATSIEEVKKVMQS